MSDRFPDQKTHPRRQCQRRATTRALWDRHHAYADVVVHVGQGAIALSVSRQAAAEMRADGICAGEIDHVRRRAVVEIDGSPITIITGRQRCGRHYFSARPRRLADKRPRLRR